MLLPPAVIMQDPFSLLDYDKSVKLATEFFYFEVV
jgi:hypothetical protein